MASRRNVQYSRLSTFDNDDYDGRSEQIDRRFDYSPKSFDKVPWKSIALALFLLMLGCLLILLAFFIFTGHMEGEFSQAYGLLGLGILTFLPGTSKSLQSVYLLIVLSNCDMSFRFHILRNNSCDFFRVFLIVIVRMAWFKRLVLYFLIRLNSSNSFGEWSSNYGL